MPWWTGMAGSWKRALSQTRTGSRSMTPWTIWRAWPRENRPSPWSWPAPGPRSTSTPPRCMRHRHLRRPVPRDQRCHPGHRPGALPSLRGAAYLRGALRLSRVYPQVRPRPGGPHPRGGGQHPYFRGHGAVHLPGSPGHRRDRGRPGPHQHPHPVPHRRRRNPEGGLGDLQGNHPPGVAHRRHRHSQDHRQ